MAIANDIADAFARIRISGEARQCLDLILRKTYGYNKKEDCIALSQFCLGTALKKPTVCKALAKLYAMNLITKKDNDIANLYRFNKDFETWKPLPKKITITQKDNIHYPKSQQSLPKKVHTKDNNHIKDILPSGEEGPPKFSQRGADIIKLFESINPACKNYYNKPPQRQACEDLIRERGFEHVKSVIENTLPKTNGLEFFPSITTPIQLREKWTTLESAVRRYKSKGITKKREYVAS